MDSKTGIYCEKCGAKLIDGVCPQCINEINTIGKQKGDKFEKFFLSPNEKMVSILGNSFLQTFLSNGETRNGFAVVSNKRVYFRGTSYNVVEGRKGKRKLIRTHQSRTVDLRDITGVGFDSYSNIIWMILFVLSLCSLIFLPLIFYSAARSMVPYGYFYGYSSDNFTIKMVRLISIIFAAICFFMYKKSQRTYVIIQYAGGAIGFDKNWYSDDEIEQFQKLVHMAKDKVISDSDKAVATALETTMVSMVKSDPVKKNSVADEISKLNDLLTKGIISQDEFEKAKKELLK